MTKLNSFNDISITMPEEDLFGIDPFAQALAKSLRDMASPMGTTIALNGPWGSGKSSAVNLIRHHLKNDVEDDKLNIIDFKCWWFRGEEALTLAFLQELDSSLQKTLGEKAKNLIPKLGKKLLQAGQVIGPAINIKTGGVWGSLASGTMDFAKRFFSDSDPIEKVFKELSDALKNQTKRFLIIIDDIDRLTPHEALAIFRLVKTVGRLPRVMYLLVYDRELAEKSVKEIYPSEGPHFLEKIVQASFDLPLPTRDDLNRAMLSRMGVLCGEPKATDKLHRFMNVFHDAVSPYLNTPRDLARLSNAITVSWPAVAEEVDVGDYLAIETLRLFEPSLYNSIRKSKERLCGTRSDSNGRDDQQKEMGEYLQLVLQDRQEQAKLALLRLFPRLENVGYSASSVQKWEADRLVCTTPHFDTYFRMSIGDDTLSMREVNDVIEHVGDEEYVRGIFRTALGSIQKNGKSKVPLLLDELNVHAARIEKEKFQPLITALFSIADELLKKGDGSGGAFSRGNNQLRIHWLCHKLTWERCSLDERDVIFMAACRTAQLGWLVDFTSSQVTNYCPRDGKEPTPLEKCLVKQESLPELRSHTINRIRAAAQSGELASHAELLSILFRWGELADDGNVQVKEWTNNQLINDESVSQLAEAFTGESWSHSLGMFGLGDRVAMRKPRAQIDGLDRILDVREFRQRLNEIENGDTTLQENRKQCVKIFLDAWLAREAAED
ncbi:MAG: KAP family NTPase [Nitrospira sp.]|nr:KAP family NTPase [Nitrospira sp.]